MTPYLVTSEEQIDWINSRESERMSWCVADLVNIHGPVPLGGNPAFNSGPTPLIFPDLQPNAVPPNPTLGPVGPPGTPDYPLGPEPYGSIPIFQGRRGALPMLNAPGPTPAPAGMPPPAAFPPGPVPYADPAPGQPPVQPVPPPPPPGPGLGSSRRPNED